MKHSTFEIEKIERDRLNNVEIKYKQLLAQRESVVGTTDRENLLVLNFSSVVKYLDTNETKSKKANLTFEQSVKMIEDIILPKLPAHIKILILDDSRPEGPALVNFY